MFLKIILQQKKLTEIIYTVCSCSVLQVYFNFNHLLLSDSLARLLFQIYLSWSSTQTGVVSFEILFLHQIIQESDEILEMFCKYGKWENAEVTCQF